MDKLAIITGGFLPVPATKGGAVENLIVNYINDNEKNKEFDITVFSDFDEKAVVESKKYNNTKVLFIKSNFLIDLLDKCTFFIAKKILKKKNSQSYRFIFRRLSFMNQVSKMLKKGSFDKILLENHPTEYLALKWRKNYLKYKNKYYYHCHNEFPGVYGCNNIIAQTKKFICVSQYISTTLQKYLNLPKEKFEVLRNGIDQKKFVKAVPSDEIKQIKEKYNISLDDKVLIFTGRITPEKGVKELLQSIEQVSYEKFKLLIVGASLNEIKLKTNYELELERIMGKVKDKVIFTGYVSYSEIPKLYSIADIAVLPSIWNDPAPLTVIESLTCGLPIITTKSGGIPEYANNNSAIILEINDSLIDNLANSIDRLLRDDKLVEEMKINSKKCAKDLTLENYCKNMNKLLKGEEKNDE